MNWYDYLSIIVGVLGFAWGVRFWIELRRWAHLIKYGRIVVAYKSKVKLNAPLQEWALWCKASEQDAKHQHSYGRELYSIGGTRIAVLNKSFVPDSPLRRALGWLKKRVSKSETQRAREGSWSAKDETVKT